MRKIGLILFFVLFFSTSFLAVPQISNAQGGTAPDTERVDIDYYARYRTETGSYPTTFLQFRNWIEDEFSSGAVGLQREATEDFIAGWNSQVLSTETLLADLREQRANLVVSDTETAAEAEYLDNQIQQVEARVQRANGERISAQNYLSGTNQLISSNQTSMSGTQNTAFNCTLFDGAKGLADCLLYSFAWTMRLVVGVFSWILYLANELFNGILKLSIIDFHKYLETNTNNSAVGKTLYFPLGDAINTGWTTIRDLFNIAFIFVLLYVAIGTILGRSEISAKKMITNIIIAALLINFSAVFPKLIIDATNVISVTFYRGLDDDNNDNNTVVTEAPDLVLALIGKMPLGLNNEFNGNINATDPQLDKAATSREGIYRIILDSFMQIIVILVAAFVLLTVAFMMMVRIIMLLGLIITSPVAFGSMILPDKLKKGTEGWWEKLLSETMWLPVFMIMFYVTIQIAQAIQITNAAPTVDATGTGGVGLEFFRLLIAYIILIGFMIYSLVIAKKIGGAGAAGAMALAGSVTALGAVGATKLLKAPYRIPASLGASLQKSDRAGLRTVGNYLNFNDYKAVKGIKNVSEKAGEIKKKLIKNAGQDMPKSLQFISDKIAANSELGLGVGFLGKGKKERSDDAKNKKEAEEAERKDKIKKANIAISEAIKPAANYFDKDGNLRNEHYVKDPNGNIRLDNNGQKIITQSVKDSIDKSKEAIEQALSGFNTNDLKDFDIGGLVNPLVAQALNYGEANAIRDKLNHGQLEKMRNYIQNQNSSLYKEIEAGNTRASWGIPKPAPATPVPATPTTNNQNPTPQGAPIAAGGTTPPVTVTTAQIQQALTELRDLAQNTNTNKQDLLNVINNHLPNALVGNKTETIRILTQSPEILAKIDRSGLTDNELKDVARKLGGDVVMRIKGALQSAAMNPAEPLNNYANSNGRFDQFINNPQFIDQTTGLII